MHVVRILTDAAGVQLAEEAGPCGRRSMSAVDVCGDAPRVRPVHVVAVWRTPYREVVSARPMTADYRNDTIFTTEWF